MDGALGVEILAKPWKDIWMQGERLNVQLCDKGAPLPDITLAQLKLCIQNTNPNKKSGADSWSASLGWPSR
eukprot:1153313-Amphidinium_carterae.1